MNSKILIKRTTVGLLAMLCVVSRIQAANTADEATALVKAGIEFVKANGKDNALKAFNDPKGDFVKGELYLFVIDYDGITLAHGGNAKLVGKNMNDLKDADGKSFIQAFVEKAKAGGGWVDYKWTNPTTKKVQGKSSYVADLPGLNAFIGCGIYK
jgi:signal transduction histidine kinase